MNGGFDSLDMVEQEARRDEAKKHLVTIQEVDKRIFQRLPLVLKRRDEATMFHGMMYALKSTNAEYLYQTKNILTFLKTLPQAPERVLHDLSNFVSILSPVIFDVKMDADQEDTSPEDVENALLTWDRVKVALEDILLRFVNNEKVLDEYVRPVDLAVWERTMGFFSTKELSRIKSFSKDVESPYYGSLDRQVDFDVDWDNLHKDLMGRKIKGNDGVICNFILNALRNSLKDQIQAEKSAPTKVRLSIKIEGDELVVRVDDDGKGMEQKHLNPEDKANFIFNPGVSDTGSTGLGLANFNTRFASLGGKLRVASRRAGNEPASSLVRYQMDESQEGLAEMSFDHLDHGTTFELRLKIEK